MPHKITFISHSDLLGGAAIVTYRLAQTLRNKGLDARMLVYTKLSNAPWVEAIGNRSSRGLIFTLERGYLFAHKGLKRDDLFKVSTGNMGFDITKHPWVRDADIINLAWINQGLLSLNGLKKLKKLGKPIVWTMHDMWCLCGICHYSFGCERYEGCCGECPFLNSHNPKDLSYKTLKKKMKVYDEVEPVFVAVSNWLADCSRKSSLLANRRIEVIPNAFPIDDFYIKPIDGYPSFDPIKHRRRIIMGAARLDTPIKGLDIAIEALNLVFDYRADIANNTGILFYGDISDPSKLDHLRFPHMYLGRINDPGLLRQIYASSDVVLSTALWENLPGTLIEGQAAGCIPVTFDRGGQRDIVREEGVDGFIAEYKNAESVARTIVKALDAKVDRQKLHDLVAERFSADAVSERYLALYRELLGKTPTEQ